MGKILFYPTPIHVEVEIDAVRERIAELLPHEGLDELADQALAILRGREKRLLGLRLRVAGNLLHRSYGDPWEAQHS